MSKIVCAEDDKLISTSLIEGFTAAGFEATPAYDGEEAIAKIKELKPDVVLLDIMMPKLDGYSTLNEIKTMENLNHSKVIFLSAKTNPKDIEKGLELGADAYVTKPYSIKKLIQQIDEMLKQNKEK